MKEQESKTKVLNKTCGSKKKSLKVKLNLL